MRQMERTSITNTCYQNIRGFYYQIIYAADVTAYINSTGNFTVLDFQASTFAYITILEYLYPVSYFCFYMPSEIVDLYSDFSIFRQYPGEVGVNVIRHIGSILYYLLTFPDCFPEADGVCAGDRLGTGMWLILDLSNFE
mmetsp:Transcript_35024/g.34025  ORF Transcript_35024/g.34025 Transcript_35024/m.34025 type:complete len:139 (+) Transcript_35024:970-1386(+)